MPLDSLALGPADRHADGTRRRGIRSPVL